ncbi:MAG: hypothetical protein AAB588_02275 [Patescibacteria group bacterium]
MDDRINIVSDLAEQEKKEIIALFDDLYKFVASHNYYPQYLSSIIYDLKNDLSNAEGEFKIDDARRKIIEEEQRPPDYSIEFSEKSSNSMEIAEGLNLVYLQVIHNGVTKPIILSTDQLKRNPSLKINGYVANIFIFGTREMEVSINGISANTALFERGGFMLSGPHDVTFEDLATPEHPESELRELFLAGQNPKPGKPVPGRYFFANSALSTDYHGLGILNGIPKASLQLRVDGKSYEIPIEQKVDEPFETMDGYEFCYLGNSQEQFAQIDNLHEKLKAITESAKEIEELFGGKLIHKIHLVDFHRDAAETSSAKPVIIFFADTIRNRSPEYLRMVTRHEFLHKYTQERGYTKDEKIRAKYADIQGLEGEKKDVVIRAGWLPRSPFDGIVTQNKEFLSFINESNYFDLPDAGHSEDDIQEFVASFLHTLLYVDRLEKNLNEPVVVRHKAIELSQAQKLKILDIYIETLEVIIDVAPVFPIPIISPLIKPDEWKEKNMLSDKLKFIKKLRGKIVSTL